VEKKVSELVKEMPVGMGGSTDRTELARDKPLKTMPVRTV
jgi:hypothetical protein